MSMMQTRWILAGSLLAAVAGCDVDIVDCDKEPDAKVCQDDDTGDGDDVDDDAGDEPGEDAGKSDAGKTDAGDAGKSDASTTDAGKDGGVDAGPSEDSGPAPAITVDDFCAAQLKTAVAWRDALEELCGGITKDKDARDAFLQEVLAYAPDDAEGKCITARNAPITAGNTTFDGTKAMACADAFAANFMAPPDPFPMSGGIDLAMYEAKIAHGAPTLIQIPACRATFKGKLARDKACTDHFECVDGLRCLSAPGNTTTCQTALTVGTCTTTSQCADGYTCVGSTAGGGKTCVKSDALPLSGGNCSFSIECATDYVCNGSNKCANPTANVVCK